MHHALLTLIAIVLAAGTPLPQHCQSKPLGLVINEDNSHFFMSRSAEDMTQEGLNAWVDQYANTTVTHLFLCPNSMKASYRSQVWDAIWDVDGQVVPEGEEVPKRWIENARLLHERNLDPYAVWIARCREKGISPWISMRMNDVHNVDEPNLYIHSHYWKDHPEFWRVPGSTGAWVDRAFDYGRSEVREHHMKFLREQFERYDFDGIELDWMRFGYHFAPGKEKEGCEILNQFMADTRKLADEWAVRRGHPIQIGARVPTLPDAAVGLGMDAITWVRKGYADMLVPTPFWATTDFDIPIELWRERIGPAVEDIILAAGCEILVRAHPSGPATQNDIASTNGFAASALHRSADQIYLFNYMDPDPMNGPAGSYRKLLVQGLSADHVNSATRRHVITYRDTVASGMSSDAQLPVETSESRDFRLHLGAIPNTGKALLVVGLADKPDVATAGFQVQAKGKGGEPASDATDLSNYPGVKRALQFSIDRNHLVDGYNTFAVSPIADQSVQQVVWVEVMFIP